MKPCPYLECSVLSPARPINNLKEQLIYEFRQFSILVMNLPSARKVVTHCYDNLAC